MRLFRFLFVILACGMLVPGCAYLRAPSGWLPERDETGATGNGGYITVELKNKAERKIGGELVAATRDSLYLVTLPPDNIFYAIPRDSVYWARVEYYNVRPLMRGQVALTFLGMVSSVTTGWFLTVLAPLYLLTGIITTSDISYYPTSDYDAIDGKEIFEGLGLYARFPLGLPSTFDRSRAKTNAPDLDR